jgi:FtsZ-binding cell division protein ZapB
MASVKRKSSRILFVRLSPEELTEVSQQLASEVGHLLDMKDQHKREKKEMKEQEDDLQKEIQRLAELRRNEGEQKMVPTEDTLDYDRGLVTVVRPPRRTPAPLGAAPLC